MLDKVAAVTISLYLKIKENMIFRIPFTTPRPRILHNAIKVIPINNFQLLLLFELIELLGHISN